VEIELDHSEHSTLRELIVEHLFIGEGLRKFWRCGITDVEVARSEIDAFGYDLVMSRGTRPSYPIEDNKGRRTGQGSKGQPQAHGQAEWLRHLDRGRSCNPRPGVVSWFGGAAPGDNLPDISHFKVAKHTKGDGAGTKNYRKDHRLVKRSGFTKLKTLDHVLVKLFGALPVERPVQ
jgi:hypothetical protein